MNRSEAAGMRPRGILASRLVPLLLAFGCDCVGDRLVILDPDDGVVLTESDDLDTEVGGLQRDVIVDTTGFHIGDVIEVEVSADLDGTPETLEPFGVFEGFVQPNGRSTVRTTLPSGTVSLRACSTPDCRVHSPTRVVTVVGSVGACPFVRFTSPSLGTDDTIVLGAADDADTTDGACGAAFAVPVRALVDGGDGKNAVLYVDGLPTARTTVADGVVDFGNVQIGHRGVTDTALLRVEIEGDDDVCVAELGKPIAVDCAGPSCAIVPPSDTLYLNASLDEDASTDGLQLNLTVHAPVTTVGHDVALVDAPTTVTIATTTAVADGAAANGNFLGAPLPEGPARFFAECTDGTLTTRSTVADYVVDTVACVVDLTKPVDAQTFTSGDDVDMDGANGIQVEGTLDATGDDCVDFRMGQCTVITTFEFAALDAGAGSATIDVGTLGTPSICGEVRDIAGNVGKDEVSIGVVPNGTPLVTIVTPATGSRINHTGNTYLGNPYVADLVPATTSCELDVTVDCSAIGSPVALVVDGVTTGAPTANCVANAASTHGGRATFTGVSIPAGAVTAHSFEARQTVATLVGVSAAITVNADCETPVLAVLGGLCGGYLGAGDDVGAAPGVQAPVSISSVSTPQVDVTVTVSQSGGGTSSETGLASTLPMGAMQYDFAAIDFGPAGTVSLAATGTDAFGNTGTTPACAVTITGLPTIALTPPPTTTFNVSNQATYDCASGTPGLDLVVSGTTNATAGSSVTLRIGAGAPVLTSVSAGAFSACVPAPEGTSNITASVNDTVPSDGVSGVADALPITITVSTEALATSIHPVIVTTIDRRAGVMNFAFDAIGDASGQPMASYAIRCDGVQILSESHWNVLPAQPFDAVTPANPGTPENLTVRGFYTGTSQYCAVRAVDSGGNLTPFPNAIDQPIVSPQFLVATYPGTVAGGAMSVTGQRAVGDVTGDGIEDFVVSGQGSAYVFRGQAGGALPVLMTTITKAEASVVFGSVVRGIGDFNRDGTNDLVVGDVETSSQAYDGEVYVFYGNGSWPASIVVSEASCAASFCVRGSGGSGLGLDAVGVGNFDGLAGNDLAISNAFVDEVLVLSSRNDIAAGTNFVIGTNDPVGFRIQGPNVVAGFGWSLGAPGSIAGSANADLVIGEYGSSQNFVYRVLGQDLSAGATGLTTIASSAAVSIVADTTLPSSFATWDFFGIGAGDFDGNGMTDLFAYSPNSPTVTVGAWILYGSAAADYPIATARRVRGGAGGYQEFAFGISRGSSFDPLFGHLGDLNRDGFDELLAGGVTATNDGNFSVGLVFGRATIASAVLSMDSDPGMSAVLAPEVEAIPGTAPIPLWTVGFVGDVVHDTATAYPDLVIGDPGTDSPFDPSAGDRIFLLY